MDIDGLLRAAVRSLRSPSYPPESTDRVRMDGNTNLLGPNPAVEEAARTFASRVVQHYPSGLQDGLRAALARKHRLEPGEILVGAGSDELIDLVLRTFVDPGDAVAYPVPTFVMYAFYAKLAGARLAERPLGPGFSLDADGLLAERAKVTLIASPNNPTGNRFPEAELLRIVRDAKGIVVLDEAYAEYCGQDFLPRIREFPNLVVLRTFSKAHGLAGIRVGWLAASKPLVDRLVRVKTPFTVGLLSEWTAMKALEDDRYVERSRELARAESVRLRSALAPLETAPTDCNFLLARVGARSSELVQKLAAAGLLVRDMKGFAGLDGWIRVTVGRPEHNDLLAARVREFLA